MKNKWINVSDGYFYTWSLFPIRMSASWGGLIPSISTFNSTAFHAIGSQDILHDCVETKIKNFLLFKDKLPVHIKYYNVYVQL